MTTPAEPTTDPAEPTDPATDDEHLDDDAETFPRAMVDKLRDENAKLRLRAQQSDELAERVDTLGKRLHAELVKGTGLLADPTDLAFDASHLDDDEALTTAIETLTTSKPHLRSRKVVGDVGQGITGKQEQPFSLMGRLQQSV